MTLTKKVMECRIKLAKRNSGCSLSPEEVIAEALKHKVYVAFSGGRCSQAALHLAIQQSPDIPVVFNNTGVEYPETVKHVRFIAEKWRLNYHELRPDTTFWKIVDKHGFPQLRGLSRVAGRPRKPKCCELMKEAPARRFGKSGGYDGFVDGIRVEESRPRALGIFQKGLCYLAERDGLWKFHPVALLSLEELMAYVKREGIPLNPLYEPHLVGDPIPPGLSRIGCMPCTGFTTWREQLAEQNPKLFRFVNDSFQKYKGEPTLWEFYEQNDTCRQEPEI